MQNMCFILINSQYVNNMHDNKQIVNRAATNDYFDNRLI